MILVCREFSNEPLSQAALEYSQEATGMTPDTWVWSSENSSVVENEWVLCATLKRNYKRSFDWLFVDLINPVSPQDPAFHREYPYELVQLRPLKTYPAPPFRIDSKFKHAFWTVADTRGLTDEPKSPSIPESGLLDDLNAFLTK